MSTTSLEQTTTTADSGLGSSDLPPADTKQPGIRDRLYRIIWRWHFYAGMIITLPLIVVAATGALYIFKDEDCRLQGWRRNQSQESFHCSDRYLVPCPDRGMPGVAVR